MKKKTLQLMAIAVSSLLLMSTTCDKQNDGPDICDGPAQITVSGEINNSYCFDEVANYQLNEEFNISMDAWSGSGGDLLNGATDLAMLYIRLGNSTINSSPGTGTFECGGHDKPAFIQLGFHGTNDEFYNSVSGSINVTKLNQNEFSATFTVSASGVYSGESVSITGTVNSLPKHMAE